MKQGAGIVLAAAVAVVMHILRPERPQVRYLAYCLSLVLMAICPLLTFSALLGTPLPEVADVPTFRSDVEEVAPIVAAGNDGHVAHGEPSLIRAWQESASRLISRHQTAIALTWLSGVALFAARLAIAARARSTEAIA